MPTTSLLAWLAVTLGHLLLTHRWVRRVRPDDAPRDEIWFDTALAGAGALAVAVHLASATGGLSVGRGAAALALWHAACAAVRHVAAPRRSPSALPARDGTTAVMEFLAVTLLAAIALAWIGTAIAGPLVTGADAAHYHVPVAVNLALGASPLDLPATQHLYPMTMSALIAWFIVPTGTLLMVDLAMLLPFALLAASVALVFRLVTGQSGLAWTTGPLLALFATPMFRLSALPSADLLFAAAFMAALTQLLRMWIRHASSAWDVVLAGLALGLLAGSKATGIPAAGLLVAAWAAMAIATRRARTSAGPVAAWPAAVAVAVLAGGIWLVRNWVLFGSPIAPNGLWIFGLEVFRGEPFAPTTDLSVLGDAAADPEYAIAGQLRFYLERWFGLAFLPWLALWVLLVPDALARLRTADRRLARARLAAVWLVVATGGPLLWLLAGAPWTSLEWTEGYALRYALPLAVVLPLLSLAACLPLSLPWHRHAPLAFAATLGLVAAGATLLAQSQAGDADSPRLASASLAGAFALVVGARILGARRARWPITLPGVATVAILGAAAVTPFVAERIEAFAGAAVAAPVGDATRAVRASVDAAEAAAADEAAVCTTRRFFVLTRFDEPLGLQSSGRPDAQVFYAAREVEMARRYGPIGPCDYIVTTTALQETIKGPELVRALAGGAPVVQVADTGRFVVLRRR